MSNLVLTRKAGESVRIIVDGEPEFLEVLEVHGGHCVLCLQVSGKGANVRFRGEMQIAEGVTVTVLDLAKGHAKLSFTAPRDVHILRTELIKEKE